MRGRCYTWKTSPEAVESYLDVLPRLGCPNKIHSWAEGYARGHAGRLAWDVNFLLQNYSFEKCLNIGGAPFLFEYLMSQAVPHIQLVSLDLDAQRFPNVNEIFGVQIVDSDIEQMKIQNGNSLGQFPCVVFCEIFEHLRIDLLGTVETVSGLLADDGVLYLTMPNGLGMSALHRMLTEGRTGPDPVAEWRKLSLIGHMGHVREYSARELHDVLEACGLSVDRCFFRRQSTFRGTVKSRIRESAQLLATLLLPSLGDEIVVVARKNHAVHQG
jgi:methyltransferase family protein